MADFIVAGILIIIIGLACLHIFIERKKGRKCFGCSGSKCSGCNSQDSGETNRDVTYYKSVEWNKKRAITILVIVCILAVLLEATITYIVLENNINRNTSIFISQIETIINNNSIEEQNQLEGLKETYMTDAEAAAYIISMQQEIIDDSNKLKNIAELLCVDELHVFDASGTIVAGTNPEYYGYNFDSGEQMSYFKPMLEDKSLSMCQDVMPNSAVGKNMMYAIAWDKQGNYMIQVGVEPKRLLAMLENHSLQNVIDNIPISEGYTVNVIEIASDKIIASTDATFENTTILQEYLKKNVGKGLVKFNEKEYFCNYKRIEDYIIIISYETSMGNESFYVPLAIISIYLFLAVCIILSLFNRLQRAEEQRNEELQKNLDEILNLNKTLTDNNEIIMKQYQILKSMADIYYSMHVVDLNSDLLETYKTQGAVKRIIDDSIEATETMKRVIGEVTTEDYVDAALEFTDLTTIANRMKNKKIITEEFVGKHIGWFQASFITVEKDEEGKPVKVVFATRSIDAIKRKEEKLIYKSSIDELTGAYNRRSYEESIRDFKKNGIDDDFIYISVDVNGLKNVNDTIGHEAGDELIVGACQCMKECFDDLGKVYRTGGDEFIILINADEQTNNERLKKLGDEIENWSGELVKDLSLSYGFVTRKELPRASLHKIAVLADKRMYEAKTMHYRKQGVDRRGQKDAHIALCALYTKILKINISDDTYQIVNMDVNEQTEEKGFSDKLSSWLIAFGQSGQVHPDDLVQYLEKTDIYYLRDYFAGNKTSLHIFYRRKYGNEYKQVMLEIIPADDYSDDNQNLFLYVKNIDK